MNVLMVFPKYEYLALLEGHAQEKFLSVCERLVDSCEEGKHKLYFIAENDTARKLKQDLPYARYISLTRDVDKDLVEICSSLSDYFYTEEECQGTDYSVKTVDSNFSNLELFEKYFLNNMQVAYDGLIRSMNVVVEFSMAKKYMRFKVKEAPKSCIYYDFNVQTGDDMVYVAGVPNKDLTKIWRGGIPSAT